MNANAVFEEIKQRFYWSGCHQDMKDHVIECHCKHANRIPGQKVGKTVTFKAKETNDVVALMPAPQGQKYVTTCNDKFSG